MDRARPGRSALALLCAGIAITAASIAFPDTVPRLNRSVDATVMTAVAIAEFFAAWLAGRRFLRTSSRSDFGLAVGLGVLAITQVELTVRATALGSVTTTPPGEVVAAGLLAVAAFSPAAPLVRRPHGAIPLAALAVFGLGLLLMQVAHVSGGGDAVRVAHIALLAAAAAGLAWEPVRRADPLIRWLGVTLGLFALVQLLRVAALPGDVTGASVWVQLLQLGAAAALLIACVGEVRSDQGRLSQLAVADERRRLARDLHDGLIQDVAFIASQCKYLASGSDDQRLRQIATAAERAVDESRTVVGALTRASGLPLNACIAQQAREFAERWGLEIELVLEPEIQVAPAQEQAIQRIVGEALSNAARHGHARHIDIRLGHDEGRLLVAVSDDGEGFDACAALGAGGGLGLRTMRERAQLLGGEVSLDSTPGRGTRVELALP